MDRSSRTLEREGHWHDVADRAGEGALMEAHAAAFGMTTKIRLAFHCQPVGRPADPNSEASRKPWLAEGISQRTYYRRKAAAAATAPKPPEQHAAHVAAWFATLGPITRLEHRAFVRRCLRGLSFTPLPLPRRAS